MNRHLLFVLLLVLTATSVSAEDTTYTIESFLQVPWLSSPVVSPDGENVVWQKRWRDLEEDTYEREVWMSDAKGGNPRRVTYDDGVRGALGWRPDGALTYLANRGESTQVWVNPLDGTEPRAVTNLPDGVHAYWWSPDGTRLAVLAPPKEEGSDEEEGDDKADWIVHDRLEHPEEYDQLWIVPVGVDGPSDEDPVQLTFAPLYPSHAAWSPDGATLAVTYNERFSSLVCEEQRVGLIPADGGDLRLVSDP